MGAKTQLKHSKKKYVDYTFKTIEDAMTFFNKE